MDSHHRPDAGTATAFCRQCGFLWPCEVSELEAQVAAQTKRANGLSDIRDDLHVQVAALTKERETQRPEGMVAEILTWGAAQPCTCANTQDCFRCEIACVASGKPHLSKWGQAEKYDPETRLFLRETQLDSFRADVEKLNVALSAEREAREKAEKENERLTKERDIARGAGKLIMEGASVEYEKLRGLWERAEKALADAVYCIDHHSGVGANVMPCGCDRANAARGALSGDAPTSESDSGTAPETRCGWFGRDSGCSPSCAGHRCEAQVPCKDHGVPDEPTTTARCRALIVAWHLRMATECGRPVQSGDRCEQCRQEGR